MRYVLFVIVLTLGTRYASACQCYEARKVSVETLLEDGVIFKGRIIEVKEVTPYFFNRMATFVIETSFSPREFADTVNVYTASGGGSCGLEMTKGETWLLYGYVNAGIILTSYCTASLRMKERFDDDFLASINMLTKYKATSGFVKEVTGKNHIGEYTTFGYLKDGKPVGQWLRVRQKDTLAVMNFKNGKRSGYQRDTDEDRDMTTVNYYELTDTLVTVFDEKHRVQEFYTLKRGRRDGPTEEYKNGIISSRGTYRRGHLQGKVTFWEDGKVSSILEFRRGRLVSSKKMN